ncbi:EamA family transporter [Puerhibacterium puerhi]|uniref:EamA family transporter n=1 Tax=Puerhibacterium puerhi TaxID=2692623 RepID=UPI0013572931|nr:EamA family transporter [Puerhibacterium puerhi]
MLAPTLALASAVVYGVVDFAGGMLSRRVHYASVSWVGQLGGLALALAAALAVPAPQVRAVDLAWGALSGVGSGLAMLFLNRALSRGEMTAVVPVSAVTGVALSVLCGVAFLGEQPSPAAWAGIAVVLPALWLVAGGGQATGPGLAAAGPASGSAAARDGLLASAGVAVQYVGLAMAGSSSGLWAVAAGRVAAVVVLVPVVARARGRARVAPHDVAKAFVIGAGAALALTLYLLATREQLLAVAVTLASLYPALPVLLGVLVLHEHVGPRRAVGLVAAGAAVVLLSVA